MRHVFVFLSVVIALLCFATPDLAGGSVNLVAGLRDLDKDWAPVDEPFVLGILFDAGGDDWPLHITGGYYRSSDEEELVPGLDAELRLTEFSFGFTKIWEGRVFRPFAGAGATYIEGFVKLSDSSGSADDRDKAPGGYIEGGASWLLAHRLNVGVIGRIVRGTNITPFDADVDVDYEQLAVMIGWAWPGTR